MNLFRVGPSTYLIIIVKSNRVKSPSNHTNFSPIETFKGRKATQKADVREKIMQFLNRNHYEKPEYSEIDKIEKRGLFSPSS